MKDEISVAVRFLTRLIEKTSHSGGGIEKEQLEGFKERLAELLCERFQNHWFPEKPARGQGYRCIRVNEVDRKDPVIDRAASQCGLSYEQLQLPEVTIWVDPKEVCCRFGEHQGSFCTLATFKNGSGEIFIDQVNFDEIRKKSQEQKEKVTHEMSSRKNGRRGFLGTRGTGSSPNFKGGRSYQNGYTNHHHNNHHHHHSHSHGGGVHGGMHHTPSPAAVSWFNSVNNSTANNGNNNNNNAGNNAASDMFSTSPPNHFSMYGLAKFSPPKYGYGSPSKWSSPPHPGTYGPSIPAGKGDKYHWFNKQQATIKA